VTARAFPVRAVATTCCTGSESSGSRGRRRLRRRAPQSPRWEEADRGQRVGSPYRRLCRPGPCPSRQHQPGLFPRPAIESEAKVRRQQPGQAHPHGASVAKAWIRPGPLPDPVIHPRQSLRSPFPGPAQGFCAHEAALQPEGARWSIPSSPSVQSSLQENVRRCA